MMESEPDPNYKPDLFVCEEGAPVQYAGNF
jgi:hypothetical protein